MPDDKDQRPVVAADGAGGGTPPAAAVQPPSAEPGPGDGDDKTDWRALWFKNRDKIEKFDAIESENAQLREQNARAAPSVPPAAPDSREQQEQARLATLTQAVSETQWLRDYSQDPNERRQATVSLAALEAALRTQQSTVHELAFSRMKPDEQESARKEFQSGQYATPEAALHAARGKRYESEADKLARERAELDAEKERRKAGVETFTRSASGAELRETRMPQSKWVAEVQAAKRAGNRARVQELYAIEDAGGITID